MHFLLNKIPHTKGLIKSFNDWFVNFVMFAWYNGFLGIMVVTNWHFK